MQCEYCQNMFRNSSVLRRHQKTAGYCLKLRGEKKVVVEKIFCEYCSATYHSKQKLNIHQTKCIEKHKVKMKSEFETEISLLKKQLEDKDKYIRKTERELKEQLQTKDEQIQRLQDKLENIAIKGATKSTTQINNIISSLEPLTQEHMEECAQFLTKKHIKNGPVGLAEYAIEFPFRNRLVCLDFDRRKLVYKGFQGEAVTDHELTKLAVPFFKAIYEKSVEIFNELNAEVYNKDNFDLEGTKKIVDARINMDNAAQGQKSEFSNKFVKEVCIRSVP